MKFYYKGQLVRTSKTHDYNWAIIDELKDGTLVVWAAGLTVRQRMPRLPTC